jgi:DNA (cytosine-5)-methyltransferase 1
MSLRQPETAESLTTIAAMTARPKSDPHALPVNRGKPRTLEAAVDPGSERDVMAWRDRVGHSRRPLCVSLWSGAGGLDLGLEMAGFDVAVAVDSDRWACQTHGYNSKALVLQRDLSSPEATRDLLGELALPKVALLAGGFPCQPYSRAGMSRIRHLVRNEQRSAVDERAFAWLSYVAAAEELRPDQCIAENVPELATFNGGLLLRDITTALEDLGYQVDLRVLSARRAGVPQFRERLFIQAALPGIPVVWPEEDAGAPEPTLADAIGDLPPLAPGKTWRDGERTRYQPPADRTAPPWAREGMSRAAAQWLTDHVSRDVRTDDLEAFRHLPPGGTYLDVPPELRRYRDKTYTDKYKRLEWDRPSRTITAHLAKDGYWYIHPTEHRTLSIREAARIQTFPDRYEFAGFPTNRFVQIGNAVPPLLGRAVGEALHGARTGEGRPSPVPRAAEALRHIAKQRQVTNAWGVLISEVAFGGRSGAKRLAETAALFPDPDSARRATNGDPALSRLGKLARAVGSGRKGKIPETAEEISRLSACDPAQASLAESLIRGGIPPKNKATMRMAARVAGISRAGSLTGIVFPVLARLASFGESAATNQAVVEIARSWCRADAPECAACPLRECCSHAASDAAGDRQTRLSLEVATTDG